MIMMKSSLGNGNGNCCFVDLFVTSSILKGFQVLQVLNKSTSMRKSVDNILLLSL